MGIEDGKIPPLEGDPQKTKESTLPEGAKLIHTFWIADEEESVEKQNLPLYEYVYPRKDEKDEIEYRYLIGWPKAMLNGPFKSLVETSPYWGRQAKFEDADYFYYDTGYSRADNEDVPKDKINRQVEFDFRQAKKAFTTLKRMIDRE